MSFELGAGLIVTAGLAGAALMAVSLRRAIGAGEAAPLESHPSVTILKPLKGVDPGIEENLRSIFRQSYPRFEVVLGSPDADDAALEIARRVAAEFPGVPSRVLVVESRTLFNPKVNLLAGLAAHAAHETLLISDSNVRAPEGYLRDLASMLAAPGVGLVSSIFRGTGTAGFFAALEAYQLNTYVAGGVVALQRTMGLPCVVGKSMLFRKTDLEAIGGWAFLGRHLAEDQVCGEQMRSLGRGVTVSGLVIDNVLGRRTLRDFLARHLRWCRIRFHISLAGYAGELMLNPVLWGLVGLAVLRTPLSAGIAAGAWLAMSLLGWVSERALGVRRFPLVYPFLELARSLVTGAVWFVPVFSRTVVWRGDRRRLGARTQLSLPAAKIVGPPTES